MAALDAVKLERHATLPLEVQKLFSEALGWTSIATYGLAKDNLKILLARASDEKVRKLEEEVRELKFALRAQTEKTEAAERRAREAEHETKRMRHEMERETEFGPLSTWW